MATVTEYEGTLSYVDENGDVKVLRPDTKTDTTLTKEGKAADAKTVGDKFTTTTASIDAILAKLLKLTANGQVEAVEFVDALPEDAADHPTTFYLVKK